MAIPNKPTITQLPPAPQRTDTPTDFANKADVFVASLDPFRQELVSAINWQNVVFTEVDDLADQATQSANAAASSAQDAAGSASQAASRASDAADSRDQAETFASAAQSSAGVPAFAGRGGFPLAVNASEDGVEYTGRYQLAVTSTTSTLDLSQQQVFLIDANSNRTLSFLNVPGNDRVMTAVIRFVGNSGSITWPPGIEWTNGLAPALRDAWTVVTLLWDGGTWRGFVSGGAY